VAFLCSSLNNSRRKISAINVTLEQETRLLHSTLFPLVERQWANTSEISYINWLTTWSRVLLEKLIFSRKANKFPKFCGTPRFITVFTTTHHLPLSWDTLTLSTLPILFNIVLPSTLRSSKSYHHSGLPTKTLYAFTLPHARHMSRQSRPIWSPK
jgi:hypothetical protein